MAKFCSLVPILALTWNVLSQKLILFIRERHLLSHCFLILCLALYSTAHILEKLEDVDLILASATDSVPDLRHVDYVLRCSASPSAKRRHLARFPYTSVK